MKDIEKDRQHERERAWNRPLSARSRTSSHTGSAGHSPSVVARTRRGQLHVVHLIRGRIHERRHPVSRSIAELLKKERRTMSASGIGVIASKMGSPVSSIVFTHSWIVCFAPVDAKHSLKWFRQAPPGY